MKTTDLFLPQIHRHSTLPQPSKTLLLVGGGRAPEQHWLKKVAAEASAVWCIDHGIDSCQSAGILPDRLIGDGDSASQNAWSWAEANHVPINRFPPEKDLTDTQIALQMIQEAPQAEWPFLIFTGVFGGRFDHMFSTLHTFLGSELPGCFADEQEILLFLQHDECLQIHCQQKPKAISLLPLDASCTGVSIQGTHWPLSQVQLLQSHPYAISNELDKHPEFSVALEEGHLGVYLHWEGRSAQ